MLILKRYVIIGASRGLGAGIAQRLSQEKQSQFLIVSRKTDLLEKTCNSHFSENGEVFSYDCAMADRQNLLQDRLGQFDPTHIYYISGGGPYGAYGDKNFKDHQWAYQVNLLTPAWLIHWALNETKVKQFIAVGSSVAESAPDPLAASYASAKHGLKGLITSLNKEGVKLDLRLFSPPYMDTAMLPAHSEPRQQKKIESVDNMARLFCEWANDADGLKHKSIDVGRR